MDSIPEDISNKKFIAFKPPETRTGDGEQGQPEEVVSHPMVDNLPVKQKDSKEARQGWQPPKIDTKELRRKVRERKERFYKEQYPLIYAKVYDLYNFEIVGNSFLDKTLKILILITIGIVAVILVMIMSEIVDLVF